MAVNHCRARHTPTISDNTEGLPVAILISEELTKLKQLTGGRHSGAVQKKSMRRVFSAVFEKYASIFSLFFLCSFYRKSRLKNVMADAFWVCFGCKFPLIYP